MLYESALRSEIPTLMAGNLGIPQPQSQLLSQQPLLSDVVTHGKVATKLCYGLEKAVKEVGGMETIMYLVAKVGERCYGGLHDSCVSFPGILYKMFFIGEINCPLNDNPKNFLMTLTRS